MNENYAQPDLPQGGEGDVIRVCYKITSYQSISDMPEQAIKLRNITRMGSGAILTEVMRAAT